MNRQEAIGYLGKDAHVASVSSDRIAIQLRIGVSSSMMKHGERVDHTEWFDVKFYDNARKRDLHMERALKGAMVYFAGATFTEQYVDNTRETRYRRWVIAEPRDVEYLREPRAKQHQSHHRQPEQRYERPRRPDDQPPPPFDDCGPLSFDNDIPFGEDPFPEERPRSAPQRASHTPAPSAPVSQAPSTAGNRVRDHSDLMNLD